MLSISHFPVNFLKTVQSRPLKLALVVVRSTQSPQLNAASPASFWHTLLLSFPSSRMTLTFLSPVPLPFSSRSKPTAPRSHISPTALSLQLHDKPIQTVIATTALTLLLSTTPILSQTLDNLPVISPSHPPSSLTSAEKSQLKQYSREHTRAAGKVAQKFSLARRQEASGQTDAAQQSYDEIIAADSSFAPAYSNRGNLLAAKKFYDQAISDYDRSLQLAPLDSDSWVVYVNRGCTKLARGDDPRNALADINLADELNSRNAVVLANRAGVWEMMAKWDSAIRDYQTALNSNDVQPFWNRYALVLFQRGKGDEALAILKRVAARFDAADVHAAMALIYYDRGDIASAETQWTMVDRPRLFESREFLEGTRKWPPRALDAMDNFRMLK